MLRGCYLDSFERMRREAAAGTEVQDLTTSKNRKPAAVVNTGTRVTAAVEKEATDSYTLSRKVTSKILKQTIN